MQENRVDLSRLKDKWPSAIVTRDRIEDFFGGLIARGTLANLDSKGLGPPRHSAGPHKPFYFVDDLIPWMENRIANSEKPKRVGKGRRQ